MTTDLDAQGPRNSTVNLRMRASDRDLIDRAATAAGKSRTDFMVDAARREAEMVLLDRFFFALGEEAFSAFMDALDQPPADNVRLRRILHTPAPWQS